MPWDKVKARLDPKRNVYWADLVQLRVSDATIPEEYPQKQYRRLLTAGVWCQVEIAYLPENTVGNTSYPFAIQRLKPIQVATGGLDEFRQSRAEFSSDEWTDVLLRSMGFKNDGFSLRQKLLLLLRGRGGDSRARDPCDHAGAWIDIWKECTEPEAWRCRMRWGGWVP
jgi:ATP-dependent Lon protease